MPYFIVEDFKAGLDVRRSRYTSVPGTLQTLIDAHITRGGDIETRKSFVDKGYISDAAAVTFGLVADVNGLVVFGSDVAGPVLPAEIRYQRLHPGYDVELTGIVSTTLFGGLLYVIADFADGVQRHFYDGDLVTDWGAGTVVPTFTTTDDVAQHLADLINASGEFTAVRLGDSVTITGQVGVDFEASAITSNVSGGVNDQTLTLSDLVAPVVDVDGTQSTSEFAIIGGSNGAGNYIDAVRVDVGGVFTDLIGSNVPFNTSPEITAANVASMINVDTGTHGYDAVARYGKVFIGAAESLGDSADGRIIEVTAKGDVCLYSGSFAITSGTASAGVNKVTSVKANGVEILGVAVDWTTSHSVTAAAVAAQIVAYASSPKFNATAQGNSVFVSPETVRSDDATGITVAVTFDGDMAGDTGNPPSVEDQYPDYGDSIDPTCVCILSNFPYADPGTAGEAKVGDRLLLADPLDLTNPVMGEVTYSELSNAPCYRIVTCKGASLVCSATAPIPVEAGGFRTPDKLMGHKVPVWITGNAPAYDVVVDVQQVGYRFVQHIAVGDRCFWAGEQPGRFILHHNLRAKWP
jgi:hypothetical protein